MYHEEIESLGFTNRTEELRKIKRWKSFTPAFYRHDLEMHTTEIRLIFEDLLPIIKETLPNLDIEKARLLAILHDDPETASPSGDVEFNKKLNMTQQELDDLEKEEEEAIEKLLEKWPKEIKRYSYKDILYLALEKNTPEAQLISYIDKFSALCESLHELYAGNTGFHKGWRSERARPPHSGTNVVQLIEKYNLISPFFKVNHPINPPYIKPDVEKILKNNKPHTIESIHQDTDLPHYDYWKKLIANTSPETKSWLIEQREFLETHNL